MKFTDGQWLLQPGVTAHYATEIHDVMVRDGEVVIHAPTRPIRHRGDTLGGPLLTVTLSSPMDDVVAVKVVHFSAVTDRNPRIPLQPVAEPRIEISDTKEAVAFRAGGLTARLNRSEWGITFEGGGRTLTKSGWRGQGYLQVAGQGNFVHEQLSLGVGECVYGLGERFTAFVKNGQVVENVNKDGGTACEQAYKAIPFYMTNRGYGVLVNSTGPISFEVASEKVARVQFSLPGEKLEYFLIYGPTPKDILRKLTALTGRPALPPAWSFGLWLTTSFTTSYDEATCVQFIEGMKQRDLPLHVFHFDCFWMREFDWCNFEWDPRTFPDPEGMLKRLRARGLKISLWINPYVGQRSRLFEEGRKNGYFIKKLNGDVWQTDLWQPGMAIVDFTNPDACRWYADHLRRLAAMGIDSFKTDFGERIPTEGVCYHDGSDPAGMHNFYPILYNQVVFQVLEEICGKNQAVVFARSSYASGQRFPIHWGGDSWSTLESMAESLRGGLSLSMCGFGYWSHDIGGFEGLPPAAVYKRWLAFGLMSSHSRLHGSSSYRVPWNYDDEACDILRFFTRLKCRLMPYLWTEAVTAHREGIPMMRAMHLEFPDDPACDTLDRQYMLGGSLLVAPVFSEDGWVDYYLPEGRWTHLLTGEVQEGGRWRRAQHGFLSLPVFVRPGTVLAIGANDQRPDYDYAENIRFQVYELADGAEATSRLFDIDGEEVLAARVKREGSRLIAEIAGEKYPAWTLSEAMPMATNEQADGRETRPKHVSLTAGTRRAEI